VTPRQVAAVCVKAKRTESRFAQASVQHVITTVLREGAGIELTAEQLAELQRLFTEEWDDFHPPRKHAPFPRCRKPSD
jgi:hypothetical protein